MTKIERRSKTVTLYPGDIQRDLDDLLARAVEAERAADLAEDGETEAGPRRSGQKSKVPELRSAAMALAVEYDERVKDAQGVDVVLHEVSRSQWRALTDEHPPREGDAKDARAGFNSKTFPEALVRVSSEGSGIDVDELSQMHYAKLERAAWNLHNEDDALPKGSSLVSWLMGQRESESKQPSEQE